MPFSALDIAEKIGGKVLGDGSVQLTGFAPAANARSGDLTFAENESYFAKAEESAASAILVDGQFNHSSKALIQVPDARVAFARILPLFFPEPSWKPGIHPTAVVAESASISPDAWVGPFCIVGERVTIGARNVLVGGNYVGEDCCLGEDCQLLPNVVLYPKTRMGNRVRLHAGAIIGSDGFGYVHDAGMHRKVPQVGWVVLGDDVEIGANVTVDRGALGPTVIGKGTKIDNLVQIAHNVVVGEHCLIVAQTGIAGSTTLGNHVILAGQTGLTGHLKIGNQVTVAAQSGVMHDIADNEKWMGSPAQPNRKHKRQLLALQQLPELLRRVNELEKEVARLSAAATAHPNSIPSPSVDEIPISKRT
jgi:UDP-3-O-[3-hydroxymyristoyl] glucosamine N-acyltransferase